MVKFIFKLLTWLGEMIDRKAIRMLMLEYVQESFQHSNVLKHEVIVCKKGKTRYDLLIVTVPGKKQLQFIGFRHTNNGSIWRNIPDVFPYELLTHYMFEVNARKQFIGIDPSLYQNIIADQIIFNN